MIRIAFKCDESKICKFKRLTNHDDLMLYGNGFFKNLIKVYKLSKEHPEIRFVLIHYNKKELKYLQTLGQEEK